MVEWSKRKEAYSISFKQKFKNIMREILEQ